MAISPTIFRSRRIALSGIVACSLLTATLLTAAVLGSPRATGDGPNHEAVDRPSDERTVLMRRKLDHAQRILGGLTEGRFGAVSRSARSLRELSEVSASYNLPTDDYRRFSDEFRRLTETLAARANAKDLDGAVLTNVQLTMNCIECHKYVRIQAKPPAPPR